MSSGRIVATLLVLSAATAGGLLWFTETRAFYEPVSADAVTISATTFDGVAEPLPVTDVEAIDADSSPLRFRACFTTPVSLATMTESYRPYPDATPLNTPGWFDCYDAGALTQAGGLVSVAGGGDTVAALNAAGVADDFSYVSTAGGAFLEWLEGRTLPGIAALQNAAKAA